MAVDLRRRASKSRYIPALAFTRLTSWYDPIVRWTTREDVFRARLVAQSAVRSGDRVLDVGCGTGTLTIKISRAQPGATITGLDGDPAVLSQAKRKASECGTPITWIEGRADALPFADSSFERVVSSLLFHHLDRPTKLEALREIRRVLAPGGELHLADWGRAANPFMRVAFLSVQLLDGFATTADNVSGLLPKLMSESGLADVSETGRIATPCGTLSLDRGVRR
jgi:ubiquinone/menaquinone biosynthesis C-methylase UbiE